MEEIPTIAMPGRTLILASQSVQRKRLLEELKIPFQVVPADIDEKRIVAGNHADRVQAIARAKAEKVSAAYPDAVILAADSYIVLEGAALEKPETLEEATQMLRKQSGQWIQEFTGVHFIDPARNSVTKLTISRALFRDLSDREIKRYVTENPVLTWSGAFSPAYPAGANLIARLEGSLTGFTHGFPMEEVLTLLHQSGFSP